MTEEDYYITAEDMHFEHNSHTRLVNRIKRILCRIIGHQEEGVYSWISYCRRCLLCWTPKIEYCCDTEEYDEHCDHPSDCSGCKCEINE